MFKPMKAPHEETNLDEIQYPVLASYKLDGIRCLFIKGEMLSCSLKQIVNKQLMEKFASLIEYSKENNCIFDGEIYSPKIPFSLISSCVMTIDHNDKKAVKTWLEKCEEHEVDISREEAVNSLKFHVFDCVQNDNFDTSFKDRLKNVERFLDDWNKLVEILIHVYINSKQEVDDYFEKALEYGLEGLILRDSKGRYKCGRATLKQGLIYKVKPYITFDAKIIEVEQGTKVNPNAKKKINELGRSVTSKKKGDRIPIERAKAFVVKYKDKTVSVVLKMTHKQKDEVWANKESYIGKMIEYKGMLVGAKDVPRHPTFVRFREDKD